MAENQMYVCKSTAVQVIF